MPHDQDTATARLARFAVDPFDGGLGEAVVAEARRTLLNYVGCVVGGSRHDTVSKAVATLQPFFGAGHCTLFGRPESADALHAALINGTANNVHGFDDTHSATIIHPGGPVLAALFALSEQRAFSGRELIDALVAGVEVSCRVARAFGPAHVDAGWHVSGTAGIFGAAAACGRILGLDVGRMSRAFGIAASQPGGLRANFGTMTVSLHVGLAARNGLMAALLARDGFTSHDDLLGQEDVWLRLLTQSPDHTALSRGLGESFEILGNTYKAYASGIVTHPVIDGCRDLSETHDLKASQVEKISLKVHPLVHELTGRRPSTALQSKVSVQHAAAVGMARRAGGIREFGELALNHPDIVRLRGLVEYEVSPDLDRDEAHVCLLLKDGRQLEMHVPHARGSAKRPLTDDDLRHKFLGLARGILDAAAAERVLALCAHAETLETASEISWVCHVRGDTSSNTEVTAG